MKNMFNILKVVFVISMILTACSKGYLIHTKYSLVSTLPPELQELYAQLPVRNYGGITVIGDGILKFDSEEHVEEVMNMLRQDCETWDDLFMNNYGEMQEEELEEWEGILGYNEFQPLLEFEAQLNVSGLMLRDQQEAVVDTWLNNGMEGDIPIDSVFIDEIEQSLYNQHREICIGEIIYQYRPNGYVMIPEDSIESMNVYREMTLNDLESLFPVVWRKNSLISGVTFLPDSWGGSAAVSATTKSLWFVQGSCNTQINNAHKLKMKAKLINFRYNENQNKWVKTRRLCSITTEDIFYWEGYDNTSLMETYEFTQSYTNPITEKKRRIRTDVVKCSISDLYYFYVFGVKNYPIVKIKINGVNYDTYLIN